MQEPLLTIMSSVLYTVVGPLVFVELGVELDCANGQQGPSRLG